jgi:hypothetical protein
MRSLNVGKGGEEKEERWSLAADCRRTANMTFRMKDTLFKPKNHPTNLVA